MWSALAPAVSWLLSEKGLALVGIAWSVVAPIVRRKSKRAADLAEIAAHAFAAVEGEERAGLLTKSKAARYAELLADGMRAKGYSGLPSGAEMAAAAEWAKRQALAVKPMAAKLGALRGTEGI